MTELTPMQQAYLTSQNSREAFEDLSAAEINNMSMSEFARRRGLSGVASPSTYTAPTPVSTGSTEAGKDAGQLDGFETIQTPQQISDEQFLAWRSQRQGPDRGIFGGTGSQAWVEAAQSQPGRSAWQGANVIESPRVNIDKYLTAQNGPTGRNSFYAGK